ncbi:MAG: 5'-nucleotidase C-terminal domain-containing protein [Treponema sp.]|nr:5'-nucleotidase C-terminal domain-containing protein [Treponema sp.]
MKKLNRLTVVLSAIALTATVVLAGCASVKPVARDPDAAYQLTVLDTNDHHGAVLAVKGKGGLAERATFVKQVRAQNKNVLVLDAGDINTGTAVSNMFDAEPDILAYNMIGYDAVAFGNHEFDGSLEKLEHQMEISKFTWLSANVKQGKKYLGKPYIIKDFDGFRVAVIGLTTRRTLVIANPDKSLTFENEKTALSEAVKTVREKEKADIVIVLGHCGNVRESDTHITSEDLAREVPGIDMFIDGHSHTYMEKPDMVNGVPIVSANEWGKYVGEAQITIKDGKIADFDWKPVEITTEAFPPDTEVTALLKPYVDKAEASLSDIVMKTTAKFEFGKKLTRYRETASGDFLTDAMVYSLKKIGVQTDFAVTNGGGIRAELPAGDVAKKDIVTMLPFTNMVYQLSLKGSDVKALFAYIGSVKQGAGAFAQVSKGVNYTITYDADGKGTISAVTINGAPIDENKIYTIATNDYMAGGGDGYVVFKNSVATFNSSILLSDSFIDYIRTFKGPVTPKVDNRITVVGGHLPE